MDFHCLLHHASRIILLHNLLLMLFYIIEEWRPIWPKMEKPKLTINICSLLFENHLKFVSSLAYFFCFLLTEQITNRHQYTKPNIQHHKLGTAQPPFLHPPCLSPVSSFGSFPMYDIYLKNRRLFAVWYHFDKNDPICKYYYQFDFSFFL